MNKRVISSPILAWLVTCFIRLYACTLRLRMENEQVWLDHLRDGGAVILCCWHQQFFSFMAEFRKYRHLKPGLMISRSREGTLVSGVAHRMGWLAVRGSSARGGVAATREMINHIREHRLGAHIVDGPRGPIGVVKKGIVHMARETGAVVVPVYAEANRAWTFKSWDRFFIPKPFTRVRVRFGETIELPPSGGPDEFEAQRAQLERIMLPGLVT